MVKKDAYAKRPKAPACRVPRSPRRRRQGRIHTDRYFAAFFNLPVLFEAYCRAGQAEHGDVEQKHPAEPIDALIEHAVIGDALL